MIRVKVNLDLNKQFSKEKEKLKIVKVNQMVSALAAATPVDTGNARDHWGTDGKTIFNTVDYMINLNAGSSRQAPSHFIEKTLLSQEGVTPSGTIVRSI